MMLAALFLLRQRQELIVARRLQQARTERLQAEEALRESEERLGRIAQAGRIGFVEWNAARDTAYCRSEHYSLLGFEPDSPINWQRWIEGVHPDDRERMAQNAAQSCWSAPAPKGRCGAIRTNTASSVPTEPWSGWQPRFPWTWSPANLSCAA